MQLSETDPEELARIRALRRYEVLDTPAEDRFDDLTVLAAQICGVPIALISLVDENRQWFKSRVGLDVEQTHRDLAFCSHAIEGDGLFQVNDAQADERFADNPLVTDEPNIRFYAGVPLTTPDRQNIGTLCVIDRVPGELSTEQRRALTTLARQVSSQLELRLANRRLRSRLAFENAIMKSTTVAVIATDLDGIITRFNPAAQSLLGYQESAILDSMPFHRLANDPAQQASVDVHLDRLRLSANNAPVEGTLWNSSGSPIPVLLSSGPIATDDGDTVGFLYSAQDIRHRATAELDLDRFFRLSLNLFCVAASDGYFKRVNPAFTFILGWSETELLARPFYDFILPDDRGETVGAVELLGSGEQLRNFENRYLCRDGSVRTIAWQAVSAVDGSIYASGLDVSDERASQAAARRNAQLLEVSQSIAKVGGWEYDLETEELFWTEETHRIHETDPQSFVPCVDTAIAFYTKESQTRIAVAFETALRTHEGYDLELEVVTLSGRMIRVRTTAEVELKDSKPVKLAGIFQDVSERIRVETALKLGNEQLRSQAQALREAQAEAVAASRAKSAFLANMSHEIRTPLNAIVGTVSLLESSAGDQDRGRMLEILGSSSKALIGIIDDVLDFSKIEAGALEYRPEAMSLVGQIEAAIQAFSGLASSKGLLLTQQLDSDLPATVVCDTLRLRQVLYNLLGNAIKFTDQGEVRVAARPIMVDAESATIEIDVVDTGIGIAAEDQSKLFEPFVQAEADTTRRFGGTGLGLAISQRLAEMMGGGLSIESAPGQGTEMKLLLRLPLVPGAAERGAVDAAPIHSAESSARVGHLLIADDNEINSEILSCQLRAWGHSADCARDGLEALRMWQSGNYDLIFADCHMPNMDGYDLARNIRASEAQQVEASPIPIIAYTANALRESRVECQSAGMDDVLVKPVELSLLTAILSRWLPQTD